MIKLYSWNVNGIRAVIRKGDFQKFFDQYDPDIVCLQETKAQQGQAEIDLPDYQEYWCSAEKKGYSGTAIFSKTKPLNVICGLPDDIIDQYKVHGDVYGDPNKEGRVITAEFEKFYLVNVYTINIKDDLSRLPLRQAWDKAFIAWCQSLEAGTIHLDELPGADEQQTELDSKSREGAAESATQQIAKSFARVHGSAGQQGKAVKRPGKPVVFCGDINVAHAEDDLANPKANIGKRGFTDEERAGFQALIDHGFIDTFRMFKQGNGHYSWWSHWANARARNVGWRIDYFLISRSLKNNVKSADIHPDVMGSDHCPVSVTLDL